MTGSVVPVAIDALVAILSGGSFTVIDGPGASDENYDSVLFIGVNSSDPTDFIEAAAIDQSWPWLGHQMRDEVSDIHCLASAWTGGTVMKTVRDLVFATFTAVGAAIQTDPSLGTVATPITGVNLLQVTGLKAGNFKETQDQNGALAELSFDIAVKGRVS